MITSFPFPRSCYMKNEICDNESFYPRSVPRWLVDTKSTYGFIDVFSFVLLCQIITIALMKLTVLCQY